MTQQYLNVHQFGSSVEQVRRISMAQLMRRDRLVDARLAHHPPQIGAGRLGRHRFLTGRAGEHELPARRVLQPEPEHLAELLR